MPDEHPIVERVRIECTDCGGLIDADMAIRHDDKPYCGECQDRHRPIVERPEYLWDPGLSVIFESEREQIIRYIEHLEKVNRNLRESCRILKEMEAEHHA